MPEEPTEPTPVKDTTAGSQPMRDMSASVGYYVNYCTVLKIVDTAVPPPASGAQSDASNAKYSAYTYSKVSFALIGDCRNCDINVLKS